MQEAPLSQLCDSYPPFPMAGRMLNFFLYALLFQLLLFLSLDYTLCPPRLATSTQLRPLPCTKDSYEGHGQSQVDSTHPALDEVALAAPSSASSDEESEEEDEIEPNVLTIVY